MVGMRVGEVPVIVVVRMVVIVCVIIALMMVAVRMRIRVCRIVKQHGTGAFSPSPLWGGVGEGSLHVRDLVGHPHPIPPPQGGRGSSCVVEYPLDVMMMALLR